uniref:Uncharacterized protein n=1 Tax=Gremmeniella abietina RNA virus MS1 TaxID=191436 RepID=A0A076FDE3_9VIRU|nr:hypothetical protein [Gremmeniella abietina RNA virus MS1]
MSKTQTNPVGVRSSPPKPKGKIRQPSASQLRFKKALARALSVRSKFLKRRLSKPEFVQLSAAVKTQIKQETTPVNRRLNRVIDIVVRLEEAANSSLSCLDRPALDAAVRNLYDRLNLVRSNLLEAMRESSSLSEGCSHVSKKSVIHLPEPVKVDKIFPGFGCISVRIPSGRQVLCCSRCSGLRNDAFFEWSGLQPSFIDKEGHSMVEAYPLPKSIKNINPLDFQHVWTSVLDVHYSR